MGSRRCLATLSVQTGPAAFGSTAKHHDDEAPARAEPKSFPLPMKSTQHTTTNTRALRETKPH